MKIFEYIASFITIIVALYYFHAYIYLSSFLSAYGVDATSIVTKEDMSFNLLLHEYFILLFALLGTPFLICILSIVFDGLKKKDDDHKRHGNYFNFSKKKCINNFIDKFFNLLKSFQSILIIILLLFLGLYLFCKSPSLSVLFIFLLWLQIIASIAYVFYLKQRTIIFYGILLIVFLAAYQYTKSIDYKGLAKTPMHPTNEVYSFDYNSVHYATSQDTILVMALNKYIVLEINGEKEKTTGCILGRSQYIIPNFYRRKTILLIPKADVKNIMIERNF